MLESKVKVVNQLGLHARAAAQLVRVSSDFKSKIILKRIETSVIADAKSILSVLALAAPWGTELVLEIDGEDEREALAEIEGLFLKGFGEL